MTFKRKGEVEVEGLYESAPKGVTYTIVRPGGLTDGPVVGPKGNAYVRYKRGLYRETPLHSMTSLFSISYFTEDFTTIGTCVARYAIERALSVKRFTLRTSKRNRSETWSVWQSCLN